MPRLPGGLDRARPVRGLNPVGGECVGWNGSCRPLPVTAAIHRSVCGRSAQFLRTRPSDSARPAARQRTVSSLGKRAPRKCALGLQHVRSDSSRFIIRPIVGITNAGAIMTSLFAQAELPIAPICDLTAHTQVPQQSLRRLRRSHPQEAFACQPHPEPPVDPNL